MKSYFADCGIDRTLLHLPLPSGDTVVFNVVGRSFVLHLNRPHLSIACLQAEKLNKLKPSSKRKLNSTASSQPPAAAGADGAALADAPILSDQAGTAAADASNDDDAEEVSAVGGLDIAIDGSRASDIGQQRWGFVVDGQKDMVYNIKVILVSERQQVRG